MAPLRTTLLRVRLNAGMAIRALGDRPSRTALTLLGIIIGILALVVMMALMGGLSASVADATRPLGAGVFQVQKEPLFGQNVSWDEIARRPSFDRRDLQELRERLTKVKAIGGEMWNGGASFRTARRKTQPVCHVAGGDPPFLASNDFQLAEGRFIDERDIAAERPVAVIGADVLDTLYPGGAREAIGSTIRLSGQTFTVIGTLARKPALFGAAWRNCLAVVPISTFEQQFGFRSMHLTFQARDPSDVQPAIDEAVVVIRSMRRLKPGQPNNFEWFDNKSNDNLGPLTLAITVAAAGICLIALLVGGVGVMNIMLVSVMERTREIGVRKALGARPSTILGQFLTEAVVLTGSGGLIGIVLAHVLVIVAARALELPATVPLWTVILAFASSAMIGLAAGIYPAAKAAKLDPIEALRYE